VVWIIPLIFFAESSDELEKLIDSTNFAASDVRNHLKQMGEAIKKSEVPKGTAQDRIRRNMHGGLTKKFLELMAEYQDVQTKYKNKYRERVERQYKIGIIQTTFKSVLLIN
jgi:syntaxin 1B/2/3